MPVPRMSTISHGLIEPSPQGQVNFDLQASLKDWSFTPQSPLQARVNARNVAVAPLAKAANVDDSDLRHTQRQRGCARVGSESYRPRQCHALQRERQRAADSVGQRRLSGHWRRGQLNLLVRTAAGNASGKLTYYPKNEGYDAACRPPASSSAKLQAVSDRNMGIAGTSEPHGQRPRHAEGSRWPALTHDSPAHRAGPEDHRRESCRPTSPTTRRRSTSPRRWSTRRSRADGKIALTGDYYAQARLDTPVIALQPILAAYAPDTASEVSGQTQIHATLSGPLKTPSSSMRTSTSRRCRSSTDKCEIGAVRPILADYVDGTVTVQPT